MSTARKLELLMWWRQITQGSVARQQDIRQQIVSDVVKGRDPGASRAVRIATALQVSANWLYDDREEWPPPKPPWLAEQHLADFNAGKEPPWKRARDAAAKAAGAKGGRSRKRKAG